MITTTPIDTIDHAAKDYADAHAELAVRVKRYKDELAVILRRLLPGIKTSAAKAAQCEAALTAEIKAHPELFVQPRTMTLHGIKIGLQKGKGKTEWPADDTLCKLVHKTLGKEAALYLNMVETANKEMLLTLEADTLKKLGYRVTGTDDQIVLKNASADVDKIVAKLLVEIAQPADGGES